MFRSALGFSTKPPHGGRSIILGGTLLASFWLVMGILYFEIRAAPLAILALLAFLLIRGYFASVLHASMMVPTPAPPKFQNYRHLLTHGWKTTLIALVYVVFPLGILLGIAALAHSTTVFTQSLLLQSAGGLLAVLTVFVLFWALYCFPVGIAAYLKNGRIRSAFNVRRITSLAFSEDYAVAWTLAAGMYLFLIPLTYVLYPLIVGVYLRIHLGMAVHNLLGQGIRRPMDLPTSIQNQRRHNIPIPLTNSATGEVPSDHREYLPAIRRIDRSKQYTDQMNTDEPSVGIHPHKEGGEQMER